MRKHSVCGAAKAAKFNSYNRKQHVVTLASGFAIRYATGSVCFSYNVVALGPAIWARVFGLQVSTVKRGEEGKLFGAGGG